MDITMNYWKENVVKILEFNDKPVLKGVGNISKLQMEDKVKEIYGAFESERKNYETLLADQEDLAELEQLENKLKAYKR